MAYHSNCRIVTIAQPLEEMARQVVNTVIQNPPNKTISLAPYLLEGNSIRDLTEHGEI